MPSLLMRSAFWSAVNEALPQLKARWSAESEAKNHGQISILPTFLLNFDYELQQLPMHGCLRTSKRHYTLWSMPRPVDCGFSVLAMSVLPVDQSHAEVLK